MGQVVEDESDEDVVGVVGLRVRVGRGEHVPGFDPQRLGAFVRRQHRRTGGVGRRRITRPPGGQPGVDAGALLPPGRGERAVDGAQLCAGFPGGMGLPLRRIEKDRWLLELVKHKDQCAEQQDEELHRDLEHAVEHQAEPALAQRTAGQIALYLGLVGAKIRQREKEASERPGPEGVASVRTQGEVHRRQFVKTARQRQRVTKANPGGQLRQQHEERGEHARKNHPDLVFLREVDRFASAGRGIGDHEQSAGDDRQVEPPAHDGRKHDRRCVDGDARPQPALHEKQRRPEETCLLVEASPEVLVGGVDLQPPVDG